MAAVTNSLRAVILQFLIVILLQCSRAEYTGKVLLVGYDGFRWDYSSLTDTPNLDKFVLEGSSAPFINNVFTTITFPSMYTIVTGKLTLLADILTGKGTIGVVYTSVGVCLVPIT